MCGGMIPETHRFRKPVPAGPIVTKPRDGCVEPIHRDARTLAERRKLLAIPEDAIGDRLVTLDTSGSLVGIREGDKLIYAGHAVFLPRRAKRSTVFSPHEGGVGERYPYRAMDDISVILSRIEPLMEDQGLNPSSLSLKATGGRSKDLIRNWQRAVREGKDTSARLHSVALVAAALGVSDTWLATGEGARDSITDEERALLAAYRAIPRARRQGHLTAAIQTLQLGHEPQAPEEDVPAEPD